MSLIAPRCDRCGSRTRHKEDDKPICQSCAEEMRLIIEASHEQRRQCPIDNAEMTKETAHMIVIDRCPTCSGVWLDGGELERMNGDIQEAAIMSMARGLTSPTF
ncbi:MAG: zf-TFIIB domain-containing protein [Myxococcota bacterium]|jgi:hypothetical protein|nr:zf-TFIIB domain-containing protein [Myxococcota bacterium]